MLGLGTFQEDALGTNEEDVVRGVGGVVDDDDEADDVDGNDEEGRQKKKMMKMMMAIVEMRMKKNKGIRVIRRTQMIQSTRDDEFLCYGYRDA